MSWSHGKDSTLTINSARLSRLLCCALWTFFLVSPWRFNTLQIDTQTCTCSFMKHSTKFVKIGSSVLNQVVQSCKLPKVVLVNALYGLGQVLISPVVLWNHCYSNQVVHQTNHQGFQVVHQTNHQGFQVVHQTTLTPKRPSENTDR